MKDMKEIASVMGLNSGQAEHLIKLRPGEAIIRKPGIFPYSQKIKIPLIRTKNISDKQIDDLNKTSEVVQLLLNKVKHSQNRKTGSAKIKKFNTNVKDSVKVFLWTVYLGQPTISKSEAYEKSGLGVGGSGKVTLDYCINNLLIKVIKVGRNEYLKLLPNAYDIIGVAEKSFPGKGGDEHTLVEHLIANQFKTLKPVIEYSRGGKSIDVGIESDEGVLGIEFEMDKSTALSNIVKDFEMVGVDKLIVSCKTPDVVKDVKKIVPEQYKNKTEVLLISKLFKIQPEELIRNE